jgi:hypothetical protein
MDGWMHEQRSRRINVCMYNFPTTITNIETFCH